MGEHPDRPPDRPREACGVVGIHAPGEEASNLAYYGLFALQHRGQESAGIAVSEGATIVVYKDMGLVSQVFDNEKLSSLPGHIAIGHVRYSTTGASLWENSQPAYKSAGKIAIALGHLPNGYALASETCALDIIGATFIREVEPGELVIIDERGLRSRRYAPAQPALCIFEFVYFARPDSKLYGKSVYKARYQMGRRLAQESPVEADLVMGVPETASAAAAGYAAASGIPYGEGLVKNRYVGRTFIQPTQLIRQQGIRAKLNPLQEVIEGRRIVVVDDSIVRGNTTAQIVRMLRDAGAREVHLRISSPPIQWPCFYGIDMANRDELIGAWMSVDEICARVEADSLAYLSLEGMIDATEVPGEKFCTACFSSAYPIPVPEHVAVTKHMREEPPVVGGQRPRNHRTRPIPAPASTSKPAAQPMYSYARPSPPPLVPKVSATFAAS